MYNVHVEGNIIKGFFSGIFGIYPGLQINFFPTS